MRRKLSFLLILALLLLPAVGSGNELLPLFGGGGRAAWWNDSSLTLWAPFDNPADPLRLIKGTGSLSFTRATTATYVHPTTGLITTAASGQLRVEQSGALIEGARTNISLYSEQLGLASNAIPANITVDNNTTTSPDGALTAESITDNTTNGVHYLSVSLGAIDNATVYTASAFMKANTARWIQLGGSSSTFGTTFWANFDLQNGVVGNKAAASTATITSYGSGWYRCSVTATSLGSTAGTGYVNILLTNNTDSATFALSYAGSGTGIYAWGVQFEKAASFPSSYIPTVASAVTRNADVLTFPVSGNISSTTGTAKVTGKVMADHDTSGFILAGNSTGYVLYNSFAGTGESVKIYDGSTQIYTGWSPLLSTHTVASRWGTPDNKIGIITDGGTVVTGNFDGDMSLGTTMDVGYLMWGWVKDLKIWNRAFTDAELQTVTTP